MPPADGERPLYPQRLYKHSIQFLIYMHHAWPFVLGLYVVRRTLPGRRRPGRSRLPPACPRHSQRRTLRKLSPSTTCSIYSSSSLRFWEVELQALVQHGLHRAVGALERSAGRARNLGDALPAHAVAAWKNHGRVVRRALLPRHGAGKDGVEHELAAQRHLHRELPRLPFRPPVRCQLLVRLRDDAGQLQQRGQRRRASSGSHQQRTVLRLHARSKAPHA